MNIYGQVGWRAAASVNPAPGVDADALAFITAASITDTTQKSAINTLVTQLKNYGIWTKLKAVYPFVGGTASQHKFNLKDPRDLDAAFRLVFNGGWTHSSTGAKPNGTTGYADTKFNLSTNLPNAVNSNHISLYIRENIDEVKVDMGIINSGTYLDIESRISNTGYYGNLRANSAISFSNTDSRGLHINTRTTNTLQKVFINTILKGSDLNSTSGTLNGNISLAARYNLGNGLYEFMSSKEQAFASIGDGLTDTEASNFYTAVQTFQSTLGRQIGTPIVADTDAQAFINAAVITNQTQANAINTLVTDLKSANIWTKMKAIYPFVGGTATTHKFNLKDPRDLDAAYRLVFSGGWTHSSTGALPNGSTGYADTKLNENTAMTLGNEHISFYSRTNINGLYVDMGVWNDASGFGTQILSRVTYPSSDSFVGSVDDGNSNYIANTDSRGLFMINRPSVSQLKLHKNSSINTFSNNVSSKVDRTFWIGARNISSTSYLFTPREFAFATIGDGLSDAEATAFYNAVQAYQTTLSRNV